MWRFTWLSLRRLRDLYSVIAVQGGLAMLSCPVDPSKGMPWKKTNAWYKGQTATTKTLIAKMVIWNTIMKFNKTFGGRPRDMWMTFPDGNLTIQNMTYNDAGYYTCRFTGAADIIIYLSITGLRGHFVDISIFSMYHAVTIHVCCSALITRNESPNAEIITTVPLLVMISISDIIE